MIGKTRLEALSDGVIAIIITIMVLELKVPHGSSFDDLRQLTPVLLSYVLSFLYVAIYWNNHHHLLHTCKQVTPAILWCNFHLLFWLSLVPFTTGWMGENGFAKTPAALYGLVLLFAAIAYFTLQSAIIRSQGKDSVLRKALGRDWKGKASPWFYVFGIVCSFWSEWIAMGAYVAVALLWLVPDPRIERMLRNGP